MTGLELLVVLGAAAATVVGLVSWSMWRDLRHQTRFIEALSGCFEILQEERGNIDRPLTLLLRGASASLRLEAVVRGDCPLWHLRQESAWAPAWAAVGPICVVDNTWSSAVRTLRGLKPRLSLSPRLTLWTRADVSVGTFLALPGADALLGRLQSLAPPTLEDQVPFRSLELTPANDASGARLDVFVEVARQGLRAEDTRRLVDGVAALVASLSGDPRLLVDAARTTPWAVPAPDRAPLHTGAASGAPLAIPST